MSELFFAYINQWLAFGLNKSYFAHYECAKIRKVKISACGTQRQDSGHKSLAQGS
jgi:hypothetical protein